MICLSQNGKYDAKKTMNLKLRVSKFRRQSTSQHLGQWKHRSTDLSVNHHHHHHCCDRSVVRDADGRHIHRRLHGGCLLNVS